MNVLFALPPPTASTLSCIDLDSLIFSLLLYHRELQNTQCNVYCCTALVSAGTHLYVNMLTCHTKSKLSNFILYLLEFQKWMHLTCKIASMMILPAEVFAVDPLSWYAEPVGPVIWLASHCEQLSRLPLVPFPLQDYQEFVSDHSTPWPVWSQAVSPTIVE